MNILISRLARVDSQKALVSVPKLRVRNVNSFPVFPHQLKQVKMRKCVCVTAEPMLLGLATRDTLSGYWLCCLRKVLKFVVTQLRCSEYPDMQGVC